MSRARSVRTRVIVGFLLWTAGVVTLVHIGSIVLYVHDPNHLLIAHSALLTTVAVLLLVGGFAQVLRGLSPLQLLRDRLAGVQAGRARRLEGAYPAEVQPLVSDLNALLEQRERAVERAQARAGDLAHGLKTPLAVLAREVERAEAGGHHAMAETIAAQVDRMRRQIEVHLANARAAEPGVAPGGRCDVGDSATSLVRALARLHADRGVHVDVRIAPGTSVRGRREDVDEMLGNLLDNACTHARAVVTVTAEIAPDTVTVLVDDDGPGLDAAMRERVFERGVQADDRGDAGGSGLGLAIVRDLAALYGGRITLEASPLGGLRARLAVPR